MTNGTDDRLNRIEEKIDRLSETMIALARVEQKLIAIENDRISAKTKLDKLEIEVSMLKTLENRTDLTVKGFVRAFWLALSVGLATIFAWFVK